MRKFGSMWRKRFAGTMSLLLAFQGFFLGAPLTAQAVITDGANAVNALGQLTGDLCHFPSASYTTSGENPAVTTFGLFEPSGVAVDTVHHRVFVADGVHSRVLVYATNASGQLLDHIPDRVLGQPDLVTTVAATTQSGMDYPSSLAYDAGRDELYVGDEGNNRVLMFDTATITDGENAVHVLGQAVFTTSSSALTATGMSSPNSLAIDTVGDRLFVSDGYRRVLVFAIPLSSDGVAASRVLGQANFTSNLSQETAAGLGQVLGIAFHQSMNRLFISDFTNDRVMMQSVGSTMSSITNGQAATAVLGATNFTGASTSGNDNSFDANHGLAVGPSNMLYVADGTNNRILVFDVASIVNGESAVHVLGQPDFDTTTLDISQTAIPRAANMQVDFANGLLYAASAYSHRVVIFDIDTVTDGEPMVDLLGQYDDNPCDGGVDYTAWNEAHPSTNRWQVDGVADVVVDTVRHRLFASDGGGRVIVYDLDGNDALLDRVPDHVLGQSDFFGGARVTTQSGMNESGSMTIDVSGGRLFVSDEQNNRVLVFDVSAVTDGENAIHVLGQADFVSSAPGVSVSAMAIPRGLAFDGTNRLFVADHDNRRVLVYNVATIDDGEAAVNVLGQPDFDSNAAATTQSGMSNPWGVAYDATRSRLFVSDVTDNRILAYDVASITDGEGAVNVLGQTNFVSGGSALSQSGLNFPRGISFDPDDDRLFAADHGNNRVLAYDTESITNGEDAVNVLGQEDFVSSASVTTQDGLSGPWSVHYDAGTGLAYVPDANNARIMVFDGALTGTNDLTLNNAVQLSRVKVGTAATATISFSLQNTLSGRLTVTFPAGFTVTGAPTGAASSGCLSAFGSTAQTIYATKTSCSGVITLGGATVTNPATPGAYQVTWVNDDPGWSTVYITSDDQANIAVTVPAILNFNVGVQAAVTDCDGTFSGNGGTVAMSDGEVSSSVVSSSDVDTVKHICSRVTSNAPGGTIVTVRNANGANGLVSTSTPTDFVASSTGTVVAGTERYGVCVGSDGADSGNDAVPGATAVEIDAPYNGTCTPSAHVVGGLLATDQAIWHLNGPSQNAFARIYVKSAISTTTPAHADYADTLTFIATATF